MANSDQGWYLNELAFKQMELPEDAPSFRWGENATPILGVIRDFQLRDITQENSPVMFRFRKTESDWWPWSYVVEVQGDPVKAYESVRKVFGSDNRGILVRLVGTFLMYVGIAFVIATPLSWFFMNQWLADYSYRITLSPLIFITAGLFCLLISFLAVFFQSWQAANANPVESVKSN